MAVVGSPGARATATDRAVAPPSRGVLVALVIGLEGVWGHTPGTHLGERVQRGATSAPAHVHPVRGAGSSWVWAVAVNHVPLPPPLGVHDGLVPGLQGGQGGSGAAHCPPWRSATLTQMEHVRTLAFGDALRATKTHPITPDTLGARVVAVLGPLVSRRPPRGGGIQRNAPIEPLVVRAEATQRASSCIVRRS